MNFKNIKTATAKVIKLKFHVYGDSDCVEPLRRPSADGREDVVLIILSLRGCVLLLAAAPIKRLSGD